MPVLVLSCVMACLHNLIAESDSQITQNPSQLSLSHRGFHPLSIEAFPFYFQHLFLFLLPSPSHSFPVVQYTVRSILTLGILIQERLLFPISL